MVRQAVWHGSQSEGLALANAVAANCACKFDGMGRRTELCVPHIMIVSDQRVIDGLLFARHIVAELLIEEWKP